jgi:hypothetical protein
MSVEDDPEKTAFLREIADEIRDGGDNTDGTSDEQIAAILYRVSDLYDSNEETTIQDIYLNMRYILGIKEQGGIQR